MSSREAKRCKRIEGVDDVASRDRISSLPNDLLIQILSLVSTRDAVATMFLSKRWRFIWTLVPKLESKDDTGDHECESVWKFDKFLELHKAPVLETLSIQLSNKRPIDVDIEKVVANAVDRFVRKLELELLWTAEPTCLPKSLYTCKTLVELTLFNKILVDVPSSACLPSLKKLRLIYVVFKDEDSLYRLVSSCSVLAQSIVCLTISDPYRRKRNPFPMMNKSRFNYDKPHINVSCHTDDKFLRAISLATSLILPRAQTISSLQGLDFSGITFSRLEQFMFHAIWLDLLPLILNNSPKLRSIYISGVNGYPPRNLSSSWNQLRLVPKCLTSHLAFFEWMGYRGSEEEKQVMRYILANSKCLERVKITLTSSAFNHEEKEVTEKEIKSMPRVSTSKLLFI